MNKKLFFIILGTLIFTSTNEGWSAGITLPESPSIPKSIEISGSVAASTTTSPPGSVINILAQIINSSYGSGGANPGLTCTFLVPAKPNAASSCFLNNGAPVVKQTVVVTQPVCTYFCGTILYFMTHK